MPLCENIIYLYDLSNANIDSHRNSFHFQVVSKFRRRGGMGRVKKSNLRIVFIMRETLGITWITKLVETI